MSTAEDLERTAERLRDALRAADDLMAPPHAGPARARRARAWLVPVTAAACVTIAIIAAVFIGRNVPGHRPRPPATAAPAAQPPEFYVTSSTTATGVGAGRNIVQYLQVRRTSTGQVTGSLVMRNHWPGGGTEIAAADDRIFYVAQGDVTCPDKTQLYRLTLSATGHITGMVRIGAVLRTSILGIAVAPDGRRLAYLSSSDCGQIPNAHLTVSVLDLASGATRSWPSAHLMSSFMPTGSELSVPIVSWMPDDRTLVVAKASAFPPGQTTPVLGLDTASTAGTLQAASRVLWTLPPCSAVCLPEVFAGSAENTVTALEIQTARRKVLVEDVALTRAGPRPHVIFSTVLPAVPFASASLAADSSGRYLILFYDSGVSWIDDGTLRTLPVLGDPLAVAW
jgi:hypothetical protein